ncbi:MAG TPA: VOC family protein [Bryobacteraceae bacterium]|jgi:catechol 2,3-dioxygenase-like lactoylglutathione lyase family enzyme|nr:VOC family protein [Bryobacteraceae bacterium]
MSHITRRTLLKSVPALAAASRVMGQAGKPQLPVRSLSHATLTVTDPKRSIAFYQGLFGMGITARQGTAPSLQIGSGVEFLFFTGGANAKPGFNHFCMAMDNFVLNKATGILEEHGVSKAEGGGGGMSGGPMKYRVRMRPENLGGAKDGTAELYIGDPDGLSIQLQDSSYCGGGGELGEICYPKPEPAPTKGLLQLEDLSHFTLSVSDVAKSQAFYQDLFQMPIQAHQGPTPLLGVGHGQFLTLAPAGTRPPQINHLSFRMKNFNQERVFKALSDFGLKPRGSATGPAGPMEYYVTLRMPNRGGAKDGTAELYFTDPDGILMQIQDTSYCGGNGVMGEICDGK